MTTGRATVAIATLNTRGSPLLGTHRAERYAAVGAVLERSPVKVVGFQEVHTYYHLKLLKGHLPSFSYMAFGRTPLGPAGGLATFSRVPLAETRFDRFGRAPRAATDLDWRTKLMAAVDGSLVTRLVDYDLCVVNTHPAANRDGDWSEGNRFHRLQSSQYSALAELVQRLPARTVVLGDFNAPRDSSVHETLLARTGLRDAFDRQCPPTFHSEYLGPGQTPRCIDFILTTEAVSTGRAEVFLDGKVEMPSGNGYVSDHVGLRVDLLLETEEESTG